MGEFTFMNLTHTQALPCLPGSHDNRLPARKVVQQDKPGLTLINGTKVDAGLNQMKCLILRTRSS